MREFIYNILQILYKSAMQIFIKLATIISIISELKDAAVGNNDCMGSDYFIYIHNCWIWWS